MSHFFATCEQVLSALHVAVKWNDRYSVSAWTICQAKENYVGSHYKNLPGTSTVQPADALAFPFPPLPSKEAELANPAEFIYLDQGAVLQAGVLDMRRAMEVIAEALVLFEEGKCRQPHKVVLRDGEDITCEERGRINALFALIHGRVRAMGMKWIASFPKNRAQG